MPTFMFAANHKLFDLGPTPIHQMRGFRKALREGVGAKKGHSQQSLALGTLAVNRTV